jgi:hypothetical protein
MIKVSGQMERFKKLGDRLERMRDHLEQVLTKAHEARDRAERMLVQARESSRIAREGEARPMRARRPETA